MRLKVARGWIGAPLALALATAACNDKPLPGTMLGTYKVVGQVQTNACGAGLMAPNPWTFDVELSQQGSTLYWSWMDSRPPLSSPVDAQGHASLTTTQVGNVDATADGGQGPCTLARSDDVEITLGAAPTTFSGTIGYSFAVSTGSDCQDQLSASGGMFDALPCAIAYAATGTRN